MNNFRILMLILLLFFLLSCSNGVFEFIGRDSILPEISIPNVSSFSMTGAVVISWDEDVHADEFILYRQSDQTSDLQKVIYRGNALKYIDYNGDENERYLYSLAKVRGEKTFGTSLKVLGVFNNLVDDNFEPNNKKSSAVWLEYSLEGNLYYIKDSQNNVIWDEDWYYIEVPAMRVATLSIQVTDDVKVMYAKEASVPEEVDSSANIYLYNYELNNRNLYFRIYINEAELITAGQKAVDYNITLKQISTINK